MIEQLRLYRNLYNAALQERRDAYKKAKKTVTVAIHRCCGGRNRSTLSSGQVQGAWRQRQRKARQ